MITLAQMRCFVAVAADPNLRRTAQRLNMSQPPLTRLIQALEHELGVGLLDRTRRTLRLTPAGARFARSAQAILDQTADAIRDARQTAKGDAGSVTIAFTATAGYAILPALLKRLREHLPTLALTLRELATPQQVDALRGGSVDFCLLRPPIAIPGVRTMRIHREPLVAALPRDHRLAGRAEVRFGDVAEETLITYPPVEGPYLHGLVAGAFHAAGISPARIQYITQTHSILALVEAGLGVAFVPRTAERFAPEGVVLRPLPAAEAVGSDLLLAWPAGSANPASATVLDILGRSAGAP